MRWMWLALVLLASSAHAQQTFSTLIAVDTGGLFWTTPRGDSLYAYVHGYPSGQKAPVGPVESGACAWSDRNPWGPGYDSIRAFIGYRRPHETLLWTAVLTRDAYAPGLPQRLSLPSGGSLVLLDASAPRSECGVNDGQFWFHWQWDARWRWEAR